MSFPKFHVIWFFLAHSVSIYIHDACFTTSIKEAYLPKVSQFKVQLLLSHVADRPKVTLEQLVE